MVELGTARQVRRALRARLPVLRRQTAGRADCDQYTSPVLQVLQALIAVLVRWWVRVAAAQGSQVSFGRFSRQGVPPPDGLLGGRSAARIEDKRSGRWVHDWRQTFEQDDRCVYPEIWVPYSARKSTIEAVEVEMPQENGLRPDVVLTLKDSLGNLGRVAVEIRVEHQKSLEDAVKFSEIGLDVIEINFGGIDLTSEDCESLLQRIVFGDLSPRCQRDRCREWLWTARAVSVLDNYHPYVDQSGFSKSERAQFPYIGRHAHIAVAKGIGKQDWGNQPRLTWEDLTRLCDIVDEIDREADSEIEGPELDYFGTIETDAESYDMADGQEDQAVQPDENAADESDGSNSDWSKGKTDKKRWWQRNPLSRFLSRFK